MVSVVVISRRNRMVYDFIELSFQYQPNSTHLWRRLNGLDLCCVYSGHNSPTAINCIELFFGGKQLNSQQALGMHYNFIDMLWSVYAWRQCDRPRSQQISKQILIHRPNLCLTRTKIIWNLVCRVREKYHKSSLIFGFCRFRSISLSL